MLSTIEQLTCVEPYKSATSFSPELTHQLIKNNTGYYYDTLKPKAKEEFIKKAQEICACDDNTKWRKLKALVKAVCGEYLLSSESINNYYV